MNGSFKFHLPTEIVFGTDVIKEAGPKIALGKKALIVYRENIGQGQWGPR